MVYCQLPLQLKFEHDDLHSIPTFCTGNDVLPSAIGPLELADLEFGGVHRDQRTERALEQENGNKERRAHASADCHDGVHKKLNSC